MGQPVPLLGPWYLIGENSAAFMDPPGVFAVSGQANMQGDGSKQEGARYLSG
jgi:hypothetical protein